MHQLEIVRSFLFVGLLSLSSLAGFADVLAPGQCAGGGNCGVGTLDAFNNFNPGAFLDSTNITFNALDNNNNWRYSGTLQTAVYRNAGNTLDFYYQFKNYWASPDSVGRLTVTDFAGFTTDVGYTLQNWDGSGSGGSNMFVTGNQAPLYADRSAGAGGTLGFSFGAGSGQIDPGEWSATLIVRTNAVDYRLGSVTTQNGAVYTAGAFAPDSASPVPEPGTMALLGAGLIGLALIRRYR